MLEKIAEMLGASPTQYRYLLNTEKIVEKRALREQSGTNLSLALTCVFCFVMSLSIAFTLLLSLDVHLRTFRYNDVYDGSSILDRSIL